MTANAPRLSVRPTLETLEAREGPSSMSPMSMMGTMPHMATPMAASSSQQNTIRAIEGLSIALALGQGGQLSSNSLTTLVEADFLFMAFTGRML
jgi:hypothetical protein